MEAGKLVLEEPEKAGGGGQQPWTRGDTVRRVFTVETTLLLWLHQDQETFTWTERRRGPHAFNKQTQERTSFRKTKLMTPKTNETQISQEKNRLFSIR